MTQRAGTPPDGGAARLLIGIPLGTLIALAIASMIGWMILGLPVAAYDPLKMPAFVWYYRGDPHVVRAMAGGLAGGLTLLAPLVYALWTRAAPLHGAARFARETEIKRHGFRSANGIVLGRKRGRFLTFGGSEHVIV
ncbi:MAG: type IV secretory system conjugative DNA transfer family protein, partial [Sphingorhabdus sp.]